MHLNYEQQKKLGILEKNTKLTKSVCVKNICYTVL